MYEAALLERLEIHEKAQLRKERDRFQMVLEAFSFALFNDWIVRLHVLHAQKIGSSREILHNIVFG